MDVAADYDVDALRLASLVRIGRELRFAWRSALFGTLLWGAFVLTVERSTPEGSSQWNRVDSDASPGFVILLAIAGATLAAQVALRFYGPAGRAAALLVPPIGTPAPVTAVRGAENVTGLLAALRRTAFVGFGVITAFLVFSGLLIGIAVNIWPTYEAGHGRGGPVVTIGVDAGVTSYVAPVTGHGGGGTRYRLDTPYGVVDAEGNSPRDGQRWTIVHDPLGGDDSAYLVGGHAYLLETFLGLAVLVLDVGIVLFGYLGIAAERRRRNREDSRSTLADSLSRLAAGARATLTIGTQRRGYRGRPVPPLTVIIGVG